MALHAASDAQVIALRALLLGGLNAELQPTTTEEVVQATYGWPATAPGRIPQLALPALAVWRESEQFVESTLHHTERRVNFRFDYVLPATPLELIDDRWELLQEVWGELFDLVCAGKHSSVSSGASLLADAGFTEVIVDARTPRVRYMVPDIKGSVYPAFQATIQMQHRDAVDISGLPDLSLSTQVYPVDLPLEERPLAGDILEQEEETLQPLHFDIRDPSAISLAPVAGTPDATAMADFGQLAIDRESTISAVHLHLIKDGTAGSISIEVYRRRASTFTQLGTLTIAFGGGDNAVATLSPVSPLDELSPGDYLFAQAIAADILDNAGDGLTIDVVFE